MAQNLTTRSGLADPVAEKVLSMLGDDGDDAPAASTQEQPAATERQTEAAVTEQQPAKEQATETVKPAQADAEQPILPPASWRAESKEAFKALPRELQQTVAERERERESHFGKTQQELATERKKFEETQAQISQERQELSQRLSQAIQMAQTMDPILAEGAKTDWAAESAKDPIATQQKWFAFQQRAATVQAMVQERDRLQNLQRQTALQNADKALSTSLDFWGDTDKRKTFQSELRTYMKSEGYSEDEIANAADHRAILMARKAMQYDRMMAEQAKISDKKIVPVASKVLRSQAPEDGGGRPAKVTQLLKRAQQSHRTDDQARAILAALDAS